MQPVRILLVGRRVRRRTQRTAGTMAAQQVIDELGDAKSDKTLATE